MARTKQTPRQYPPRKVIDTNRTDDGKSPDDPIIVGNDTATAHATTVKVEKVSAVISPVRKKRPERETGDEDSSPRKRSVGMTENKKQNQADSDGEEEVMTNGVEASMPEDTIIGIGASAPEPQVQEKKGSDYVIGIVGNKANESKPTEFGKKSAIDRSSFKGSKTKPPAGAMAKGSRAKDPRAPVAMCLPNVMIAEGYFMSLWIVLGSLRAWMQRNFKPAYVHFLLKFNASYGGLGILSELGATEETVFDLVDERGDYIEVPDPRGKTGPRRIHAVATFKKDNASDQNELEEIMNEFVEVVNNLEWEGGDGLDRKAAKLQPSPFITEMLIGELIGHEGLGAAIAQVDNNFRPFTNWGADKTHITANFFPKGSWKFRDAQFFGGIPLSWLSSVEQEKARIYIQSQKNRSNGS